MTEFWYQCSKCATLVKNNRSPDSAGCPEDDGKHNWRKLAEFGDTNYQCAKCGTTIQAKTAPYSAGCPKGRAHEWKQL
jgi:DNA-directed RNA polymerase subunit RPC12/RpoP